MAEIDDPLSYAVIGMAMAAHRELGPGLDEAFYHELLARKLTAAGIPHETKPRGKLLHRGRVADEFEADLIVEGRLAAELKVLWGDFAPEHLLQLICYLKFWRLDAGLLFDFAKESLAQKRVPRLDRATAFDPASMQPESPVSGSERSLVREILDSLHAVLTEFGLGYRDSTYRGLLLAELLHRKIPCAEHPTVAIRSGDVLLGEAKLPCLILPGQAALLITALRETRQAADRAVLQTCLRHLDLTWGLLLNFGKTRLDCQLVKPPMRRSG
ncbi:MAG TPA: GxxExxY protein [Verrucomicrobiae bacterium]